MIFEPAKTAPHDPYEPVTEGRSSIGLGTQ